MENYEIINYLIQKNNYHTYLEVGVWLGTTFKEINIDYKESCDVDNTWWPQDLSPITYLMTSDEMFSRMPIDKKYDIIFLDGLHTEECLDRDIINSLKHLNPGGLILCHDVLPLDYHSATEISNTGLWNGTCWKSICKLQDQNIQFHTLNQFNYGLTIIHYIDNPYQLHFPQYKCTINFEYIFKNGFKIDDNISKDAINFPYTEQGKYVLHIIDENEFLKLY